MKKWLQNKKILLLVLLVFFLIIFLFFALTGKKSKTKKPTTTPLSDELVIPTVDSSVRVELNKLSSGQEVLLKIENAPKNTQLIEYELSYDTISQGYQGVIGSFDGRPEQVYEKKIYLGTCSSGTCVPHQLKGKIKVSLKFSGNYGERVYEKEF